MTQKIKLSSLIPADIAGQRFDQALAQLFPDYSRAQLSRWIQNGQVTLDHQTVVKPKAKVKANQTVTVDAELEPQENWQAQAISLNIVHQDDHIIVVNKPPGLVVHPGAGNMDQTLVNALLHHFPELETLPRAGIIHRLDKDTSGLLIIARNLSAHHHLVKAIQNREIKREYQAIVEGEVIAGGTIDAPIGRHPTQRIKMAVTRSGKPAITHYRVLQKLPRHTLLSVQLETGRTHQIRVHLAHLGYPIVGDQMYNRKRTVSFPHQALHAYQLMLLHPMTQQNMTFTAQLPKDMQQLLDQLQ